MQTQPLDRDNQIAAADAAIALAFGNATLHPTFRLAASGSASCDAWTHGRGRTLMSAATTVSPHPCALMILQAVGGVIEL